MMVREFFKENGWSQSNNVVATLFRSSELCLEGCYQGCPMPFWNGDHQPFGSTRNIITFSNGLMDLDNPSDLIPHTAKWCSTFCSPFAYEPSKTCPNWEKFLCDVFEGDQDRMALVQEFFGYCLSSDTSLQKAMILVGKPRSEKGQYNVFWGHWLVQTTARDIPLSVLPQNSDHRRWSTKPLPWSARLNSQLIHSERRSLRC